jgi:LysR family transcriptional regulator, glycine cleavage system transcriptional activator
MPRPMPPLNALRAFEATARHLSFSKAAAELHVTPAALSHQVRALEEVFGRPLFVRRARAIDLTEAGKELYPGLRAGFEMLRDAVDRLDRAAQDNILVVSGTPGLTAKWLVPRLYRFLSAHPEIETRVTSSRAFANFTTDGIDVAIRMSTGVHPGLHVETLMEEAVLPLCSPRLVARGLKKPQDLARFDLIQFELPMSQSGAVPSWTDWLRAARVKGVDATRGLRLDAADHALDAAAEGAGVVLAYKAMAMGDIRNGRLVSPFGPELAIVGRAYHLVCPAGRETQPKIRAFRDWLMAEIAASRRAT